MLDRSIPPQIHNVTSLNIPAVGRYHLDNGIEIIEVNQGTQGIIRLEVLYDAGRTVEDKQLAARFTASLQKEGTANNAPEILAEKVDYYGSSINSGSNFDFSYFSIFVLDKYFVNVLSLLAEVLHEPTFREEELVKHKDIQLEKLKSSKSKSDLVAYRKITEDIFGTDHAYGYNTSKKNISELQREDLVAHFEKYHTSDRCKIIIAGKIHKNNRSTINKYLGQTTTKSPVKTYRPSQLQSLNSKHYIKCEQEHQTAIKIGRKMFNRQNDDFAASFMMNTVLGGYFGSRLMVSIRENLGYTYNIYSSLDPLVHDGYFTINTEVSNDLVDLTVKEIYRQIDILQQEKIKGKELEMVRNYVMGNFLNMVDGPFRIANVMKTLSINNIRVEEYENIIRQIYHCTTNQIQDMAQKYLSRENMIEVFVGSQF